MQQRDLLKDQIEQLGRVLGKIIAEFLHLQKEGKTEQAILVTNELLKDKLDVDIKALMKLNQSELAAFFKSKLWTAQHVAQLADYLIDVANYQLNADKEKAIITLKKVVALHKYLATITDTFSIDHFQKEQSVLKLLQQFES